MVSNIITSDASSITIAGVAIIRTAHAGLRNYFWIGPRWACRIAQIIASEEISEWATSAVEWRKAGSAVTWACLADVGCGILEE